MDLYRDVSNLTDEQMVDLVVELSTIESVDSMPKKQRVLFNKVVNMLRQLPFYEVKSISGQPLEMTEENMVLFSKIGKTTNPRWYKEVFLTFDKSKGYLNEYNKYLEACCQGVNGYLTEPLSVNGIWSLYMYEKTRDAMYRLDHPVCDYIDIPMKVSAKTRLSIIEALYNALGYECSNDIKLLLASENKQQIVFAPAGGAKTTTSQLKLILQKILYKKNNNKDLTGSQCMCLVYNRENTSAIKVQHSILVNTLTNAGLVSDDDRSSSYISTAVTAKTLHSFCKMYVEDEAYNKILNLKNFKLDDKGVIFDKVVRTKTKDITKIVKYEQVALVYELMCNFMYDSIEDGMDNPTFCDTVEASNVPVEVLTDIFVSYKKMKKMSRRFDFTDYLLEFKRLLELVPELPKLINQKYKYFVVDEYQDFTPLMATILSQIVTEDTTLMCIGDEDQSIYGFRGASVENMLDYKRYLPLAHPYNLVVNRRCGENIVDVAAKILELNMKRVQKKLVARRDGGEVLLRTYTTDSDCCNQVVNIVHNDRLNAPNTVVAVREKLQGQQLTFELYKNRIGFQTLNASSFTSHVFLRAYASVLATLADPNRGNWRNLYKVLSINSMELDSYLEVDKYGKPCIEPECRDWTQLSFEPFLGRRRFAETLNSLKAIVNNINIQPMSAYYDWVLQRMKDDYFRIVGGKGTIPYCKEALEWIEFLYNKNLTYNYVKQDIDSIWRQKGGVTVATMHSLKGLEYDNVIIPFLDDDVFPSFSSIDSVRTSDDYKLDMKEGETRLMYVAVTRARDRLYLVSQSHNPSLYTGIIRQALGCEEPKITTKLDTREYRTVFKRTL